MNKNSISLTNLGRSSLLLREPHGGGDIQSYRPSDENPSVRATEKGLAFNENG